MNEILQQIMEFINNNTLILIGICIFLILVLIGYLVDNSVKSKRVRTDIKNAAQVPENIKDEIIKEAKETEIVDKNEQIEEVKIEEPAVETPVVDENAPLDLDGTMVKTKPLNLDLNATIRKEDNYVDPDQYIMEQSTLDSEYSNDKKLSEILYSIPNKKIDNTNIFAKNKEEIKNEEEELDRIMRKLSNMNNDVPEDNYTNIF